MTKSLLLSVVLFSASAAASAQGNTAVPTAESMLGDHAKKCFVVIRQDYQLVDDEEGELKNAPGKDYWKRTYSLGIRVGNDNFLVSGETVKPWRGESLSKNDRFQPAISSTAVKAVDATEFDDLSFDESDLTEVAADRLYTMPGSEEQGMTLVAPSGRLGGYAVMAVPDRALSENNEKSRFTISVTPMTFSFAESKKLYAPSADLPANAMGGVFVVPVTLRPGLVDYCITGVFQKVGGVWKLVCPESGMQMAPDTNSYEYTFDSMLSQYVNSITDDIDNGLSEFFGL